MAAAHNKVKVIDCHADDNQYLHKDFHGGLCYGIKYLDDNFGPEATAAYLRQVARSFFEPLTQRLRREGLSALEKHFRDIFTLEGGATDFRYEGDTLVISVQRCPAVDHLKQRGQLYTERFCLSTVVVNETVCADAGYCACCEYEPGQGRCVQKFWKAPA